MAENESLDLGRARRWLRVLRAVLEGKPPDQIAVLAGACLRQTIKVLRKPVKGGPPQLPLTDLLNAIGNDPCAVERIVKQCQGHDFAYLFHDSTFDAQSREAAAESFVTAIREKYFDQIEIQAVKADGQHTFTRIRSQLDQVHAHLRLEIKQIAQQLAANPSHSLRRPRSNGESEIVINTQSVLGESLLGLKR